MELKFLFDKLNKITLFLLTFLTPILFLPFTQNYLDFPKAIFAQVFILLSLVGWIGKRIFEGEFVLKGNKKIYLALLLIFLSILISSVFSSVPKFSFLGLSLDLVDSFLNIGLFLIFAFLVANSFEKKSEFLFLLFLILLSGFIGGIFNLLQIHNVFILPIDFTKNISFNLVGTPNSFALFSLFLFPISLILTFKGKPKIIFGLISFILFLNLLFINFKTAWSGLIISVLVFFIFGVGERKINPSLVSVLMILLIVSIFFYLFPGTLKGFPLLPPEISLSFVSEIEIIKGAFLEKVKNLIFGTGPTTFILDYSRFRSPLLNQTVFWGTRFSRGHSAFFDWVLTKGVFGGLSLIFLYLLTVFIFVKNLKKENLFDLKLGLSASLFSAIYISFFYPLNFTLWFLFWFLLGTFWFFFSEEEMRFKITTPSQTIFSNFIFMVSIILAFILIFFNARSYLAENNYFKATIASGKGETEQSINYLTQAIKFNYLVDTYWRDLSQMFLTQATQISQDPNIPLEEKRARINLALSKGGEAINQAIRLGPMNVANWNVRGFFYQNLIGIKEAENLALASYRTAIQLEPVSPYSFGEIGRVYILIAQNLDKEGKAEEKISNLNSAIESLNKAIALKPDYAPAHYLSAVALDQLGKLDEAILKLEQTAIIAPRDIGVRFQLGMLYWRKGEIEKAQSQFEQIINLTPDYSNARYMLGLIFDKKGEKEKAKSEFETVAKLNPENQEVKKILENLEKGLPALEGIVSTQPTVKELPPEIKK